MLIKISTLILCAVLIFLPAKEVKAFIDYGKQTLVGEDFSNSNLRGATFYLTNLQDADLSNSDLEGASLFGAKLLKTNLSDSNLRNATLDSAGFDGTDLTNSILEDAFAYNATFKNVKISGADFTNVVLSRINLDYLCSVAEGVNPITNRGTKDSLGCN